MYTMTISLDILKPLNITMCNYLYAHVYVWIDFYFRFYATKFVMLMLHYIFHCHKKPTKWWSSPTVTDDFILSKSDHPTMDGTISTIELTGCFRGVDDINSLSKYMYYPDYSVTQKIIHDENNDHADYIDKLVLTFHYDKYFDSSNTRTIRYAIARLANMCKYQCIGTNLKNYRSNDCKHLDSCKRDRSENIYIDNIRVGLY